MIRDQGGEEPRARSPLQVGQVKAPSAISVAENQKKQRGQRRERTPGGGDARHGFGERGKRALRRVLWDEECSVAGAERHKVHPAQQESRVQSTGTEG